MMKPEEILKLIQAARGTAICVPTMTTSPAWRKIAPDDLSVGCIGFMGGASAMGLGLALGAPDRRVIVFDGDGSLLMQLGSIATIAGAAPRNFTHLLFKNGVYHTSGSQETPGGPGTDFAAMAKAAGYRNTYTVTDARRFQEAPARLPHRGRPDHGAAHHRAGRQHPDDRGPEHALPPAGGRAARKGDRRPLAARSPLPRRGRGSG